MCALASVACPQRPTSTVGVNQRSAHASVRRSRNAVSAWFISRATSCIHRLSRSSVSTQTAAGLPLKAVSVKASTTVIGWAMGILAGRWVDLHVRPCAGLWEGGALHVKRGSRAAAGTGASR